MNIANTIKATGALILTLVIGAKAHADQFVEANGYAGKQIECTSVNSPVHKLHLYLGEILTTKPSNFYTTDYYAQFESLHGPRLVGEIHEVVVKVRLINTRVKGGIMFQVHLANGGELSLEEITYTYNENVWPLGFSGTFTEIGGTETALMCEDLQE